MKSIRRSPTAALYLLTGASGLLTACGGGGGGSNPAPPAPPPPPAPTFAVGGNVSGLAGNGLILRNNNGADLAVAANGAFTFPAALTQGSAYSVTVQTQPSSPGQTCAVTNGAGNMGAAAVTNVAVNCTTHTFSLGGTVSGLAGSGLVLRNNGDDLPVTANGAFTFPTAVAQDSAYNVTVQTHPSSPWQTCAVTNGGGNMGNAAIANVAINCTVDNYQVGGTVSGLAGAGLTLTLNGGGPVAISQNGAFTLNTPVASGASYTVALGNLPVGPGQTCVLTNPTGQIAGADIANVTVACTVLPFTSIVLAMTAADLAMNHATGELYVSVANTGNGTPGIRVLDPRTGEILRTVGTTQIARPLAVSGDSQYLYAGMGATGRIQRFNLPALTPDIDINLGLNAAGTPLLPADIRVAPNAPQTIAVSREYTNLIPSEFGVAVYDNAVARAATIGNAQPGTPAEGALWNSAGTRIYSLETTSSGGCAYRSSVSASGLTLDTCTPHAMGPSLDGTVQGTPYVYNNVKVVDDRLYTSGGAVYDPEANILIGRFNTEGQGFAIDTARNKAFFTSGIHVPPLVFQSFNLGRQSPHGRHEVANASGNVHKLLRFGDYGLAAATPTHLVLASGTFVSNNAPTTLTPSPESLLVTDSAYAPWSTYGAYTIRAYAIAANDLQWDAARQRLLVSVAGYDPRFANTVLAIDPDTNLVASVGATGSHPTWLSQSDDGSKLYVSHGTSSFVSRLNADTLAREVNVPMLTDFSGIPAPAFAISAEAQPGSPNSFAYVAQEFSTGTTRAGLVDGLTHRGAQIGDSMSNLVFASANLLYGHDSFGGSLDLRVLTAGAGGLTLTQNYPGVFGGGERLQFANNWLYSTIRGLAIDPATRAVVGDYTPFGSGDARFAVNIARDRGYYAWRIAGGAQATLAVIRLSDSAVLDLIPFYPGYHDWQAVESLGSRGVALSNSYGHVVIVEGPNL